jgi:nucleoside-diphosphate-sugar epimerase
MTRILITGAQSFVGMNFIKNSRFKDVTEISLFENRPEDIDFKRYDVIIHLVAIVHQSKAISNNLYYEINRDLCLRTATKAKNNGVRHFIFMSSVKVYGKFFPKSGVWNEDSICQPEDGYGKSKYEAEILLKKMEDENFTVSIIRTPLVYGENVKANMLSIMRLVDRVRILPFKSVNNKRSFTAVENLTAFIDRIIELRIPGIFIAMDKKSLSTTELVEIIANGFGKRVIFFKLPNWVISLGIRVRHNIFDRLYGSFELDNTQSLKRLDFTPPFSTDDCILKMVCKYKEDKKKK